MLAAPCLQAGSPLYKHLRLARRLTDVYMVISPHTIRLQTLIFPLRVGKHQYQKASLTPILEKSFFVPTVNWVRIYNGLPSPKNPLNLQG